jgi:hypothetical protein
MRIRLPQSPRRAFPPPPAGVRTPAGADRQCWHSTASYRASVTGIPWRKDTASTSPSNSRRVTAKHRSHPHQQVKAHQLACFQHIADTLQFAATPQPVGPSGARQAQHRDLRRRLLLSAVLVVLPVPATSEAGSHRRSDCAPVLAAAVQILLQQAKVRCIASRRAAVRRWRCDWKCRSVAPPNRA